MAQPEEFDDLESSSDDEPTSKPKRPVKVVMEQKQLNLDLPKNEKENETPELEHKSESSGDSAPDDFDEFSTVLHIAEEYEHHKAQEKSEGSY